MTQEPAPQTPGQTSRRWIIENVLSLGIALLLVFMIRSSVVEAFKIPSGSMIPTLLIGDHIFVNKFAYGLKVPFSDLITGSPVYVHKRQPPQRGDIVVFIYPKDESFYYIKRVVGIPGDTIEVRDKVLLINGREMKQSIAPTAMASRIQATLDDPKYSRDGIELRVEGLERDAAGKELVRHPVLLDRGMYRYSESFGPVTVPADSLFVMGDNRDFSNDSRFWGFVPYKNVKGKAMVIWLSMWVSLSEGKFVFRPMRIGTVLDRWKELNEPVQATP